MTHRRPERVGTHDADQLVDPVLERARRHPGGRETYDDGCRDGSEPEVERAHRLAEDGRQDQVRHEHGDGRGDDDGDEGDGTDAHGYSSDGLAPSSSSL